MKRVAVFDLEQLVERAERVVLPVGARLVELVDHDHRVGVVAVQESVEHLARLGVLPLRGGARQHPARGERAHRHEAEAGAEQLGHLAREMRLADSGLAEQQHRRQLDRVVGVDAQREVLADVGEHLGEVGQLVEQALHRRQRRGLDGEALAAEAHHLLVERAQRLVGGGGKLVAGLSRPRDFVDVLEARDRYGDVSRHLSPAFLSSRRCR